MEILKVEQLFFIVFSLWFIEWLKVWAYFWYGLVSRAFTNGSGDQGSIPNPPESYQKLKKMVLDGILLNIQDYQVQIKGEVEKSRERSRALPYTFV